MSSWGSNDLGSPAATPASSGFTNEDWARLIQGGSQGAGTAMSGLAQTAGTFKEAREARRRTLGNLFKNALGRKLKSYKMNQEYGDEMATSQADELREIAKGFASSLGGLSRR